jgi:putative ABC transport system permease protein
MSILMIVRVAAMALTRNRLRTALTTLGIMVGIAAVMCTVALGEGSSQEIERQLLDLGDNFIWIEAGGANVGGVRTGAGASPKLVAADMEALTAMVPAVRACSPQVDARVQIIYGNENWNTTYRGVSPEYLSIRRWSVDSGSMFSAGDVDGNASVVVLGKLLAEMLFGDDDPLGKIVRLRQFPFKVIGILRAKGVSSTGQDQDDTLFIPYTTAQRKLRGITWLDDIMCSTHSAAEIDTAETQIAAILRERHRLTPGVPDDFNIRKPQEALRLREESARTMGIMLAAIASVSLLVGGIGIMNIMLVSVAERTREIGLRMSLGARASDIRRQFFAEALALSLLGGLLGIAGGFVASRILAETLQWAMPISSTTIFVAVGFSTAAGMIFGYYPARRAAALDPIEALRFE